ncbi:MAG: Inner membrane protein YbhN [Chroococcopsis gigantea SAG 12.99]|jgi:uncharacterized membrane protein YbhN (UPF0104 family)|nr:UPF0104 family protein [Chlorogloea purpurea SAG 13.99]MDV3002160.1 Inner membrane protein YbhN [Chroococcopsis gigantea SAG 12.99]
MNRLRQIAPFLLTFCLFLLAVWAIKEEFKHYTFQDLVNSLGRIPTGDKLMSVFLMIPGYLSMAGYDWLGFIYVGRHLHPGTIVRTSFISYALGNTVGFTVFSGTAIRYRFYSPAGVSNIDIAKVIAFTHLSFWLGMLTIGGVSFLVDPLAVPQILKIPVQSARSLGIIFLCLVALYFWFIAFAKKPLKFGGVELGVPSVNISLALIVVAFIDWGLAAAVLYVLLPDSYTISFFGFFGIYIFAMTAGVISNVPGGLGVFEFMMLKLRPESVSESDLLGALLAYRGIYYLLPLSIAFIMLVSYEVEKKYRRSKDNS